MAQIPVSRTQLGIICRFKASAAAESSEGFGHVDAILPRGAPVGFYVKDAGILATLFSADSMVWDYGQLAASRPFYVTVKDAKSRPCVSTAYIIDVTIREAMAFEDAWSILRTRAPTYRAAGANCATFTGEALEQAGIMKGGIDGLDTPDNLFKALTARRPGGRVISGYFGFAPGPGGGFVVECA